MRGDKLEHYLIAAGILLYFGAFAGVGYVAGRYGVSRITCADEPEEEMMLRLCKLFSECLSWMPPVDDKGNCPWGFLQGRYVSSDVAAGLRVNASQVCPDNARYPSLPTHIDTPAVCCLIGDSRSNQPAGPVYTLVITAKQICELRMGNIGIGVGIGAGVFVLLIAACCVFFREQIQACLGGFSGRVWRPGSSVSVFPSRRTPVITEIGSGNIEVTVAATAIQPAGGASSVLPAAVIEKTGLTTALLMGGGGV